MALTSSVSLAPAGSNAVQAYTTTPVDTGWNVAAVVFTTENAGTTATWKVQGSFNGTDWFDVGYVTDASDSYSTATRTTTAQGASVIFLARPYPKVRLNVTANTGFTFHADIYIA